MTAPPLDTYYDQVADDPPYLAPDETSQLGIAQRRIEELEWMQVVALQEQADHEYCLEAEERRRIEREKVAKQQPPCQPSVSIIINPVVIEHRTIPQQSSLSFWSGPQGGANFHLHRPFGDVNRQNTESNLMKVEKWPTHWKSCLVFGIGITLGGICIIFFIRFI